MLTNLTPRMIYDEISKSIIGQDEAKKTISNALFLHYVHYLHHMTDSLPTMQKANVLLMGPSGCGKTFVVREGVKALRKLTGHNVCPLLEIDATELTPSGYVGSDPQQYFSDHHEKYGENQCEFNTTVVFIDEIDKLCSPASTDFSEFRRGAQYSLLKLMEGKTFKIKSDLKFMPPIEVNTEKMLFVLAGNFPLVRENRTRKTIGIHAIEEEIPQDKRDKLGEIEAAGLATQIVGRVPFVAEVDQLTGEQLKEIITTQLIPKYAETWKYMGHELNVPEDKLDGLVDKCVKRKTGARGLQADLVKLLEEELFDLDINL